MFTELEVAAADLVVEPRSLEWRLGQRQLRLPAADRLLEVALTSVHAAQVVQCARLRLFNAPGNQGYSVYDWHVTKHSQHGQQDAACRRSSTKTLAAILVTTMTCLKDQNYSFHCGETVVSAPAARGGHSLFIADIVIVLVVMLRFGQVAHLQVGVADTAVELSHHLHPET